MTDHIWAAHRRADCVLNYTAGIVLAGLVVWTQFDQYTVNQGADVPALARVADAPVRVTPLPVLAQYANAGIDQSECLAEALYYEARGEGTEGEKAVAEVVLQRTRDRGYPRTICEVVYEGVQPNTRNCQFSFACDGALRRPKEQGTWRRVRNLAERIVQGAVKLAGETGHAIAYHKVGIEPPWAEGMQRTAQIGNHIFYRRDPARLAQISAAREDPDDSGEIADNPLPQDPALPASDEIQPQVKTADTVGQGA